MLGESGSRLRTEVDHQVLVEFWRGRRRRSSLLDDRRVPKLLGTLQVQDYLIDIGYLYGRSKMGVLRNIDLYFGDVALGVMIGG